LFVAAAFAVGISAVPAAASNPPPLGIHVLIVGRTYALSGLLPGYTNVPKTWKADAGKASPACRIDGDTQLVPLYVPTPSYAVSSCGLEVVLATGEKYNYSLNVYPARTPKPQPSPVRLPRYGKYVEARSDGWVAGALTYTPGKANPSKVITIDSDQISLTLPVDGELVERVKGPGYGSNTSVICYMYDKDSDRRSVASEVTWQYPVSEKHFVEMSVLNKGGVVEVSVKLKDSETFKTKRLWLYTSKARPGTPAIGKGKVSLVRGYQGAVSKVVLSEVALRADGSYVPRPARGGSLLAFNGYVACGAYQ
jgi:hypothetical protein